ncbi:MAG: dihydropteroate synthase [Balneolaceae bacterium]|nr:dihydropteroate synthase [Balneolaceae bacterium]
MGILNVTPDSFSDGGKYDSVGRAIEHAAQMISEGADVIDVGGESTRPGSDPVSEKEELERVIPVLEKVVPRFPDTLFSIDTTKYVVALEALKCGVHIINDVSGLEKEPRLAELCAEFDAGYILMHSQGDPKTMQENPEYGNVLDEISLFFREKLMILNSVGVEPIIVDPGIGFGKTLKHNLQIVNGLEKFSSLGCPILAGASRKSMIGQILNGRPAEGRLAGTISVHLHSLINGASLLRVHDVQEAYDSIQVFLALKKEREL